MADPMRDIRADQARGEWDLRPEQLAPLLLIERRDLVPAPREVLQNRLNSRQADKDHRTRNGSEGWPWSVSDRWLQQEIDYLQRALASGVMGKEGGDTNGR